LIGSVVLAVGVPAAASAAPPGPAASQITAPADNSYLSVNLDTDPNKTVTVTGTATDASNNPYTGTVDLDCTAAFGGTPVLFSQGASNVTVTGGSFSTDVKVADLAGGAGNTCVLRAVPHDAGGAVPADVTPYAGPNLAIGFYDGKDKLVASGPNAGKQYDYLLAGQGFSGQIEPLTSAGDLGARNLGTVGPAPDDTPAQGITFAAETLWNNPSFSDGTKTTIVVDGKNAYTPSSIANPSSELYSGSNAKSGFQPLQATGYSVDPSTGATTLTETDPLVRCVTPNPGDPDPGPRGASTNPASATNCPSFTDARVKLVRTITYDHDGAQLYFQDSFQSTDAAQHNVDLRYFNGLQPPVPGDADTKYKFDWSGADQGNPPHTYSGGDSVAASPVGINTIDILANGGSQTSPSGTLYSRAAITFSGATSGAKFNPGDEYAFELNFLNRTVPATGSLKMNMAYSIAPDQATLDPLVTAAQVRVAQPPVVTTSTGSTAYTEGAAATPVDSGVTVTDPDSANLSSAQVRISSGFEAGDTLGFTNQSGISGSYNSATGVLTLSGSAPVADYQTALQSVTYSTASNQNPSASKTVEFKANDGTADSNLATKTLAITPVNTAPTVTTSGGQASYTEGSTPVQPDPAVNVSDPDSAQLKGATVSITGNFTPADGDTLSFTNTANITGSYDAGTGVLTLSGNDTVANYQDALRSVMFSLTSQNPSSATRTVRFQATDTGNAASNTATRNVGVSAVNNAPTVTTSGGNTAYTEAAAPVTVDAGITATDPDSANFASATVSISSNFQAGDQLAFADQNGISGAYDGATGVLTLSGSATKANYQTALRSIQFSTGTDHNPQASKTVSFKVNDGSLDSNTATKGLAITPINDPPTLTTTGSNLSYTEGDGPVAADPGLTVNDPDSAQLQGATVSVTGNFVAADDSLGFTNQSGITGSYDAGTGVLTLSGNASVANYQAALRTVTYQDSSQSPSGTKTLSFQATDTAGAASNVATRAVSLTGVNDAPTVTTTAGNTAYTQGGPSVTVDSGAAASDVDSANLASAQIRISAGFQAGDSLDFVDQNGISGSYNAATGVLTLSGSASVTNYQTALRSIKYATTNPTPSASKTVEFKVNDGALDSNAATKGIAVTAVNSPPTVTTSGGSTAYTENAAPTAVDAAATVTDPDSATLQSARVRISVGFESTDVLSFTNQNGISGSYDAGTGVLTLTGASTVANYQTALRDVKFNSTSDNPGTSKTVEFNANDGVAGSNAATKDLAITRVDDPPSAADDSAQVAENASASTVDVLANDSDVDGGPKQVVSVTQPGHGTAAVTGGGTGVSYQPAANYCNSQQGGAPDTFKYTLNGGSQANVSISVTCAGTAAKPVVTVTKRLAPTTDPGRFDLRVNGAVVKAAAGNGGHGSTPVDSGSDVIVSEAAANGHPLGDYRTAIDCGTAGSGTGASLTLTHVTADVSCTVTNTRRAVPRGRLTISHHDTTVTRGHTIVRLFCHGASGARCRGTLHLEPTAFTTRLHHASATSSGRSVRFSLGAGKDKSYAVHVPKETRAQLARKHKAVARAVARLSGGRTVRLLITLISH
jgi:hypothetical protein